MLLFSVKMPEKKTTMTEKNEWVRKTINAIGFYERYRHDLMIRLFER